MAQPEKNKGGRPLKFKSVKELKEKIDAYFKECDPHIVENVTEWVQARDSSGSLKKDENGLNYYVKVTHNVMTEQIPYKITGLALALGCSRQTLLDYENGTYLMEGLSEEEKQGFLDTIKEAKTRIASYVEDQLYGTTPTGAIFNLKANFGYRDNIEEDTKPPANPIQFFSMVPTAPPAQTSNPDEQT